MARRTRSTALSMSAMARGGAISSSSGVNRRRASSAVSTPRAESTALSSGGRPASSRACRALGRAGATFQF